MEVAYPCAFGICKGRSAPLQRSHPDRNGRLFLPFAPRERRPRSGGTVATHDPHHTRRVADRLSVGTMLGAASLVVFKGAGFDFSLATLSRGRPGPPPSVLLFARIKMHLSIRDDRNLSSTF